MALKENNIFWLIVDGENFDKIAIPQDGR